jgi:hypothetical protein
LWYGCAVFGLDFGELFIVAFVVITVLGAPYAAPAAERLAVLLPLVPSDVDVPSEVDAGEQARETGPDSTEEHRG